MPPKHLPQYVPQGPEMLHWVGTVSAQDAGLQVESACTWLPTLGCLGSDVTRSRSPGLMRANAGSSLMKRGFMDDSAGAAASPSAFACPHCGAEEVRWHQDACVRYDVLSVEDGMVLVDAATLTVIRYEKGEFACGNCQRRVHLDESGLRFKRPTFELNREALDRGFAASCGDRSAARLSLLPGGVFESFGEFAEWVVSAARYDWKAITGPGSTSVRLQPLFPYGEQILPIVTVGEAESAGKAVSRKDLGEGHGHGLMVGDLTAAAVLCGFAVDAANEVLERPEVVAEITE